MTRFETYNTEIRLEAFALTLFVHIGAHLSYKLLRELKIKLKEIQLLQKWFLSLEKSLPYEHKKRTCTN